MAEVTSHAPGAFTWIELGTTDQNGAKEFYGRLFGWTFEDQQMGPDMVYTTFRLKGRNVAAAYTLDPKQHPGVPPHWMLYVATADADATARRVGELGGKVMAAPFDVMDFGRMAVLTDPRARPSRSGRRGRTTASESTTSPGRSAGGSSTPVTRQRPRRSTRRSSAGRPRPVRTAG